MEVAWPCVCLGGVSASSGRGGNVPLGAPVWLHVLRAARPLGLQPEASAQSSLCPVMWGHLPTCPHLSVRTGPSVSWPLALGLPLHPKTPGDPSHVCPGSNATASPSQCSAPSQSRPLVRLPSHTDGSSAVAGCSLHPRVRLLFLSLLAACQPHPVPPAPPLPAPPGAAPTGASHTHK